MYTTSPTTTTPEHEVRHFADDRISFDPISQLVSLDGEVLRGVTPTQAKIVDALTVEIGKFVAPDDLHDRVYNKPNYGSDNLVPTHMSNFRRHLPEDLRNTETGAIKTRYILGYCAVRHLSEGIESHVNQNQIIEFASGRAIFLPGQSVLVVDGEAKRVRPQLSPVILKLVSNPDTIITREAIEAELPTKDHAAVRKSDYAAAVVSEFRNLMGAELGSRTNGVIRTDYGRGYRVVTAVE